MFTCMHVCFLMYIDICENVYVENRTDENIF